MEVWRKNLYVLWGAQFLAMVGMNLVVPFLPFFIRQLGVTDQAQLAQWSGFVFAGPFLTAFIATPFWGSLGDKYGKKIMVVRAIIGLGVSQILIGFSQDVYQLLFFRVLQGAISGFIAAALALVSTSTPKERIGYSLGILQSATAGGTVFGPAIGGLLADIIGYRPIFFIVAGVCFLSAIVIARLVKEVPRVQENGRKPSILQNYKFMATHKQLRLVGLTIVLSQAAALMIEPIFALFIESFRTTTSYISTITGGIVAIPGIFMLISAPWWGKRNDRLGFKKNLMLALGGTGIAYALHIIVPNIFSLTVLRAGLGFTRGGILHALYSLTSLHAPQERKSGLIGIASSLAILGNMIGPPFGGLIAGHFALRSVFVFNSIIFLLTCALIWKYLSDLSPNDTSLIPKETVVVAENSN